MIIKNSQPTTCYILHAGDTANFNVSNSNHFSCNLTGKCLEIPHGAYSKTSLGKIIRTKMTDKTEQFDNEFAEIFSSVIEEGKNILIEYQDKYFEYDDINYISFSIISVNNCKSYSLFSNKLDDLYKKALDKIKTKIFNITHKEALDFLELIEINIEGLKNYTVDKFIHYPESEYGPAEDHTFRSFANPDFTGPQINNLKFHQKSIEKEATYFAEIWDDALEKIIKKINFLLNQVEFTPDLLFKNNQNFQSFVDIERLKQLKAIKSAKFDLSKLIRYCEELNIAFEKGLNFSITLLVRAIIDHIPPIFNKITFDDFSGSYGTKSFKDTMIHLNKSLRKIADSHLHTPIRKREVLPNRTQVNFSNDLDVLLGEIVRVMNK